MKFDTLSTSTTMGEYTLDFSSYLPNDGYEYEVLISLDAKNSTTTAGVATITEYNMNIAVAGLNYSNVNCWFTNSFIIPVKANRTLTLLIADRNFASLNIYVCGYKRIYGDHKMFFANIDSHNELVEIGLCRMTSDSYGSSDIQNIEVTEEQICVSPQPQ